MTMEQIGYFLYMDELDNDVYYPDVEDSDPVYCAHRYHNKAVMDEDYYDRYYEDDEYGLYDTSTYDW